MASETLEVKFIIGNARKASSDVQEVDKSLKKLGETAQQADNILSEGMNPSLGGLARVAATAGPEILALVAILATLTAGVAALGASIRLASESAPLSLISTAFGDIADNSTEMLAAMENASGGMVRQIDLMKSYNLAAQLVGKQFADQLPVAFEALGKVAASTGQDMGYLMDSLVRGVGRLSPLILDNLGIQVDLNAAYQTYAQSIGMSVDQLTKAQQQTALMNQVMTLLQQNTANLPSVVGTAQQAFAAFSVAGQNVRDTLGTAFAEIYSIILPVLTEALNGLNVVLKAVFDAARPALRDMREAFRDLARQMRTPEMRQALEDLGQAIGELIAQGLPIFIQNVTQSMQSLAAILQTVGPLAVSIFASIASAAASADRAIASLTQVAAGLGSLARLGIPGFAGGVSGFRGGYAVVGERGPELVKLPAGSSVYQTNSPFNNYGPMSFNVNNRATFTDLARQARIAAGAR